MINTDRAELIASLRELRLELSDNTADMLEADAQELTRLRDLARDAANAATQLQKQVLLLRAQQVPVAWLKFARKKPAVTSLSFSSELSTLEKAHGFVSAPLCHCAPPAEPDMFWNHDDADKLYSSISEFLNDEICNGTELAVGDIRTIQRAVRLPNIDIRITSVDEDECDAEYEIVEAQGDKP